MPPLIEGHLTYLAEVRHAAARTVSERRLILHKADRELPAGLDRASEAEIGHWLHTHRSAWTIHTYDTALRVYFSWGVAYDHHELDPMARLPKPPYGPRIPRPWSDEEARILLTEAPLLPWRRAAFLAAYAGLRCSEIATVTSADIVWGRLRVRGKGGKERMVPIHDVLSGELDGVAGPLCPGVKGRAITGRTLSVMQGPVWDALGLPGGLSLHGGRHRFACSLLEQGADLREIQILMGHASLATTEGYLKVLDRRLTAAVGRLPRMEPVPATNGHGLPRAA